MGRFKLNMPGLHNVYNALSAVAVGLELEIDIDAIKKAFAEFSGVQRRFQVKGEINDVMVVDDYGHHPTEIKATLAAAKSGWDKRTIVIFQPHRYTRTKDLMKDFATAFYQADVLILTDIYAAGETPIEGVTGERLYETIKGHGHKEVMFIKSKNEIPDYVFKMLKKDDIVITLGAGDVYKIGGEIVERMRGQK